MSAFLQDASYARLWRRATHRHPFLKRERGSDPIQRLYEADPELAYQALRALGGARERLTPEGAHAYFTQLATLQRIGVEGVDPAWLLDALEALGPDRAWRWFHYGVRRVGAGGVGAYLSGEGARAQAALSGLRFGILGHDVERVLRFYNDALAGAGRVLTFYSDEAPPTPEPDALYLPDRVAAFPAAEALEKPEDDLHFVLYKWLITHELGHRHAGTYRFRAEDEDAGRTALKAFLEAFPDPHLAEAVFHLLEDVRVEAQMLAQYPGFQADRGRLLRREFDLRPEPQVGPQRFLEAALQHIHWGRAHLDVPKAWQAALDALLGEAGALAQVGGPVEDTAAATERVYAALDVLFDTPLKEPLVPLFPYEARLDLRPPARPPPTRDVPQTQLEQALDERQPDVEEDEVEGGVDGAKLAFRYDEWDYREEKYRANWCALHERAPPASDEVPPLSQPQVAQVRRAFEWMTQEDWVRRKRQLEGDELDLDAWVEGTVDRRAGQPPPEKIYTQRLRKQRDLCAAILLDQSDSTARLTPGGAPVIALEREALGYLCEALETLRDEFAIFTYSGEGREGVACYPIKSFDERYGLTVLQRLAALEPLAQNRDGCALRHATHHMLARRARTKLLLHITDGRPWDHGYTQRHALEDTKKAIQEARSLGVKVFGVICDPHAPVSVKNTYGPGRAVILRDVTALSDLLLGLYRRITW